MATQEENLAKFQEIANRGLQDKLDPNIRARFDEALNRGMITQQQVQPEIIGSVAPPALPGVGITGGTGAEVALPTGEREITRAEQDLPELGSGGLLTGEDKFKIAKIAPAILVTTNPDEIADIIEANFDNIKRSTTGPGGLVMLNNQQTGASVVVNQPGVSKMDVLQGLGLMAAFAGPGQLASAATKAGALGLTGVKAGALAGAAGSGGMQAGIEGLQAALGGEINEEEIALAASLGGAVEVVVPAIQALRQRRLQGKQAKELGVNRAELAETKEAVKPAQEAIAGLEKATGQKVGLFQAQQTQQPSTLIKQRFLPQLDASSRKAAKALENQNKEVFEATTELISRVAPEGALETGAGRFRDASQIAIDAAKERRRAATKDIFEEAMKEGVEVNIQPTKDMLKSSLVDARVGSKLRRSLERIEKSLEPGRKAKVKVGVEGVKAAKPSLRELQLAKFEIDEMLEDVTPGAMKANNKREVLQIQKTLVDEMKKASPLYKAANDKFEQLSPAIAQLKDSIIGKASQIDNIDLEKISKDIFSGSKVSPQNIQAAKKVIDKADPGAWDDIMRVELQRRIGGIETKLDDQTGELIGNIPGQLKRAIFGNDTQRKALLSGMDTPQRQNFLYLEDVLKRAETGRAAGSPTAPFQQVARELRGPVRVFVDAILKPKETFLKTGDDALLNLNASKMADVLFNPKWEPKLKELRKLNPLSEKAGRIFKEIFDAAKPAVQLQQTEPVRQEVTQ